MKSLGQQFNVASKLRFGSVLLPIAAVVAVSVLLGGRSSAATPTTVPMNIYYGTTHMHTGAHNDHGGDSSTALNIFQTAKANGFNFVVLTEHSGPTGPTDPAAYYADAQAQAAATTEDGKFVGLAGYEYSENSGDGDSDSGHMTGWGTEDFVNAAAPGMNFNAFLNYLVSQSTSRTVFAGFNHPPATGHAASAPALLTPERRAQVVMTEAQRNVGYNATDESNYYKGMVAALDRGWQVAPTCGLDGHGLFAVKQQETSTKKPCRAGVLAPELTRDSLLAAFHDRRIYTSRDANMRIKTSVNGYWMGSEIPKPATASFNIQVSDPNTGTSADKIKKVEVIGNTGKILATKTFNAHSVTWNPNVTVGTNTYMFVRVFNGERSVHTAVAAPVWFR